MHEAGPLRRIRFDFQQFVNSFDTSTYVGDQEFRYLCTWLQTWLAFGDGFESTGQNFETYLRAALDIADAAMRGEIDWDYAGTREKQYKDAYERLGITALHNPTGDAPDYADRANYETMLFRW